MIEVNYIVFLLLLGIVIGLLGVLVWAMFFAIRGK